MFWSCRFVMAVVSACVLSTASPGHSAEKLLGVVANIQHRSGWTHLAVRSPNEILLADVSGDVVRWNPTTGEHSLWRKVNPDGDGVSFLQANDDGIVFLKTGNSLKTTTPKGETQRIALPKTTHLAISPTSRQLATIGEEPPLLFFDPQTGETTHRVDRQVWIDEMHYSPRGDWLASSRFGRLYLWNPKTGELLWKTRLEGDLKGFVFSPDQSAIFASFGEEGLWVIDIKTGNLLKRHSRPHPFPKDQSPHRMAISSDGMLLALTVVPDRIEIWETFTGRPILLLAKHAGTITNLEFLPDGARLVSADDSGQARLWDLSAAEFADPFSVALPFDTDQLRQLWRMLGDPEGRSAWTAMIALKHRPEQALELIRNPPNDDVLIRQLIQRLDDDEFRVRAGAFQALRQFSLHAEPILKNALSTSRSAEVKARVRRLLAYLAGPRRESQRQSLEEAQMHRELRVVELLRWIGTDEALDQLKTLRDEADLPAVKTHADRTLRFLSEKSPIDGSHK